MEYITLDIKETSQSIRKRERERQREREKESEREVERERGVSNLEYITLDIRDKSIHNVQAIVRGRENKRERER